MNSDAENNKTENPPSSDPRPKELRTPKSLLLVHTGHGKGKSSSAFGVMIRGVAREWKVGVVQFIKSGSWHVGEEKIGRQLELTGSHLAKVSLGIRKTWIKIKKLVQRPGTKPTSC